MTVNDSLHRWTLPWKCLSNKFCPAVTFALGKLVNRGIEYMLASLRCVITVTAVPMKLTEGKKPPKVLFLWLGIRSDVGQLGLTKQWALISPMGTLCCHWPFLDIGQARYISTALFTSCTIIFAVGTVYPDWNIITWMIVSGTHCAWTRLHISVSDTVRAGRHQNTSPSACSKTLNLVTLRPLFELIKFVVDV